MIYFDNSATTYPKPSSVIKQAYYALKYYSFNSGRGGYAASLKCAEKIFSVREKIGTMFSVNPENVAFTKNCTEALNIAIKGSLKKGDHVIISSLEHNSVSRVVEALSNKGMIDYDIARFSFDEDETVSNFEDLIKPNTSLIVCMHSSNVFGVVFPINRIGKLCKKHNIRFVVDAAQGAGVADIDMKRDNIDVLCSAGHKSLLGPMGTGFIAVKDGIKLNTLIEGGTGSKSLSLFQPDFMPDRFESGTLNNSGIIALGEGIDYIHKIGMNNIYKKEISLSRELYSKLSSVENVKLYTPKPEINYSMPIVSFNYSDLSSEAIASILSKADICVRAGYHCSPLAHKHFDTLSTGTVRVSLGCFNNEKEINKFVNVVKNIWICFIYFIKYVIINITNV